MSRWVVQLVAVAALSGCSFGAALVAPKSCSLAPAVLDTGAATGSVGIAAWAFMQEEHGNGNNLAPILIGMPAILLSMIVLPAAAVGYVRYASCPDRPVALANRKLGPTPDP